MWSPQNWRGSLQAISGADFAEEGVALWRRLLSNNCYIFFSYKALQNINNLPCIRCVFTAEKRCVRRCIHCYKFAVNFAKGILPNRTGFLPDSAWMHRVRAVHSPLMDLGRSRFRRPCRRSDAPLVLPVFPMIVQGGLAPRRRCAS